MIPPMTNSVAAAAAVTLPRRSSPSPPMGLSNKIVAVIALVVLSWSSHAAAYQLGNHHTNPFAHVSFNIDDYAFFGSLHPTMPGNTAEDAKGGVSNDSSNESFQQPSQAKPKSGSTAPPFLGEMVKRKKADVLFGHTEDPSSSTSPTSQQQPLQQNSVDSPVKNGDDSAAASPLPSLRASSFFPRKKFGTRGATGKHLDSLSAATAQNGNGGSSSSSSSSPKKPNYLPKGAKGLNPAPRSGTRKNEYLDNLSFQTSLEASFSSASKDDPSDSSSKENDNEALPQKKPLTTKKAMTESIKASWLRSSTLFDGDDDGEDLGETFQ